MNKLLISFFLSALMLSAWALIHSVQAQTPPPEVTHWLTAATIANIDQPALAPTAPALKEIEVALSSALVADLNGGGNVSKVILAPVHAGLNSISLQPLVSGTSDGVYKVWARTSNVVGARSTWAFGQVVGISTVAPPAPATLRFRLEGVGVIEGDRFTLEGKIARE